MRRTLKVKIDDTRTKNGSLSIARRNSCPTARKKVVAEQTPQPRGCHKSTMTRAAMVVLRYAALTNLGISSMETVIARNRRPETTKLNEVVAQLNCNEANSRSVVLLLFPVYSRLSDNEYCIRPTSCRSSFPLKQSMKIELPTKMRMFRNAYTLRRQRSLTRISIIKRDGDFCRVEGLKVAFEPLCKWKRRNTSSTVFTR